MSQYANFVQGELVADILAGSVGIDLIALSPGDLPANAHPDRARLLLVDDLRQPTKFEIVSYSRIQKTASGVRILDVERGLDGTTAVAFSAGAVATTDLFASQVLPVGDSDAGDSDVLTYVQSGGLALRELSIDDIRNATPGNPILLEGIGSAPATPATDQIKIYLEEKGASVQDLKVIFDNASVVTVASK